MHSDVPTCRTDGSDPTAAGLAAYKRCHATVTRPVSRLRTARAASVQSVSPADTRCDVPVHDAVAGIDARAGTDVVGGPSTGASTLSPAATSARNGSRGAWVATAIT